MKPFLKCGILEMESVQAERLNWIEYSSATYA